MPFQSGAKALEIIGAVRRSAWRKLDFVAVTLGWRFGHQIRLKEQIPLVESFGLFEWTLDIEEVRIDSRPFFWEQAVILIFTIEGCWNYCFSTKPPYRLIRLLFDIFSIQEENWKDFFVCSTFPWNLDFGLFLSLTISRYLVEAFENEGPLGTPGLYTVVGAVSQNPISYDYAWDMIKDIPAFRER